MNCVFCGDEITGRPIRREGQVYCSLDCVYTAAEVSSDEDEYRMEDIHDDSLDMDLYEEVDEY